ncbi:MAG: Fe-S cluster assembly protein SufD [Myxococcota bacterium]|nr:Fe-S cluster assembly protein SufD [Myxococcota bacterium]
MSEAMDERKRGKETFVDAVKAHHQRLNGGAGGWVHDLRLAGLQRFEDQGLPTGKLEGWRYTNVKPIVAKPFMPVKPATLDATALEGVGGAVTEGYRVVLNNGCFDSALSTLEDLPSGVVVMSLAEALKEQPALVERYLGKHVNIETEAFAALNTAFLEGGLLIVVPKGVVLDKPIHFLCVTSVESTAALHPRCVVALEENSQASFYESYQGVGDAVYLNNCVTEFHLGENANLTHIRLQDESPNAYHIASLAVRQQRSSQLNSHIISLGGETARTNIEASVNGEGADCRLHGLYWVDGRRHADIHIVMDHAKAHGTSLQYFKGMLDDKGTSVFDGRVVVREGAQKIDAVQRNNNLLLSKQAQANTRPQLEIYADDVKCAHGATVGQLDENQVFYLRSRGLDLETARRELTHAFANEVLASVKDMTVRESLESLVRARLTR